MAAAILAPRAPPAGEETARGLREDLAEALAARASFAARADSAALRASASASALGAARRDVAEAAVLAAAPPRRAAPDRVAAAVAARAEAEAAARMAVLAWQARTGCARSTLRPRIGAMVAPSGPRIDP